MSDVHNPASTNDRAAREAQFTRCYSHILSEATDAAPSLWIEDIDSVVFRTAETLMERYEGSPDDDLAYREFASAIIRPAVVRLSAFYQLKADNTKVVRKAIWSVLSQCKDLGVDTELNSETVRDIESIVWLKVFHDLDNWLAPGYAKGTGRKPAKITTRLYQFSRAQARGWKTAQLRWRERYLGYDEWAKHQELEALGMKPSMPDCLEVPALHT